MLHGFVALFLGVLCMYGCTARSRVVREPRILLQFSLSFSMSFPPELQVELRLLTSEEVEQCITSEFNPVRAAFHGTPDVWTENVLNMGVRPDKLIERVRFIPLIP